MRNTSWLEAAQEKYPKDDQYYIKAINDLGCNIDIEHLKDLRSYLRKQGRKREILCGGVKFFQVTLSSQNGNNRDLFNYLVQWYQSSFEILDIDIRKSSLPILVQIQKNPLSSKKQRKWAESKILELFSYPEITGYGNIETLTDYFLDKYRPEFTNKVLEETIEKHLLRIYKMYRMLRLLLKISTKYNNDSLLRKCEPQVVNSYLDSEFESCPWDVSNGKNDHDTHHKLIHTANQICKDQTPLPFDINKFNSQQRQFYCEFIVLKLSPLLAALGDRNAMMSLLLYLGTTFYFYQSNQMKMPKDDASEYMQDTRKAVEYFKEKYNYGHPLKLIREGHIENSESQGPIALPSGTIVLPPSPQCDLFCKLHEISHQYHGDLQMLPIVNLSILIADYIYSTKLTQFLSIMLPILIIPIQKSLEKRADVTALDCLKTINEKKKCIANWLVTMLRVYPFNREIVSPPVIALHTYPNGIQRILRLCDRAGIGYADVFLPYFNENHPHAYKKFKDALQPRPTTFIDRLLSIPGLALNFCGDTMTLVMSTCFQPIRPIIRSENAIKASDIVDKKIHRTVEWTQNAAVTARDFIDQKILKRI